jgi:hypothetical protein
VTETDPVPFEFTDVAEARRVASLLRRQASAFQLLAGRLTDDASGSQTNRARPSLLRHGSTRQQMRKGRRSYRFVCMGISGSE